MTKKFEDIKKQIINRKDAGPDEITNEMLEYRGSHYKKKWKNYLPA